MVICPICSVPLLAEGSALRCEAGHCFDRARQGYVNLLTVQQKHSLHPGDTREMVLARRSFLDAGYYQPIAKKLRELTERFAPAAQRVLDVGCGEGYYLSHLTQISQRVGIDISKEAVRYAAGRDKQARWYTATASHLPFSDGSFDCLLSMFALTMDEEYARVLGEKGVFIQVLAGETHLPALKQIIYPTILEKEKPIPTPKGFELLHRECLEFDFTLEDGERVAQLLSMTPHVWRISKEGADRLAQTQRLEERAQVRFSVYGKI